MGCLLWVWSLIMFCCCHRSAVCDKLDRVITALDSYNFLITGCTRSNRTPLFCYTYNNLLLQELCGQRQTVPTRKETHCSVWLAWRACHYVRNIIMDYLVIPTSFCNNGCLSDDITICAYNPWRNSHNAHIRFLIDVLVQERHNSIANALELRLSFTNPSIWCITLSGEWQLKSQELEKRYMHVRDTLEQVFLMVKPLRMPCYLIHRVHPLVELLQLVAWKPPNSS